MSRKCQVSPFMVLFWFEGKGMAMGSTLASLARLGGTTLAIALVLGGCQAKKPATPATTASQQTEAAEPIRLANETVELVIDPAKGRIMHYGFVGGPNVLWTNDKAVELAPKNGGWENWGGDKTWPWPQTWGWPPPAQRAAWTCMKNKDGSVGMASPLLPAYGLQMVRRVELAKKGTAVTITSWFEGEEGVSGAPVAMWAITQVPATDLVLMRSAPGAGGLHFDKSSSNAKGIQTPQLTPRVTWLQRDPDRYGKVSADADAILCVYGDTAMLQRDLTEPVAMATYDRLARGQLYSQPDWADSLPRGGKSYLEVEFISPTAPLSARSPAQLKIRWSLLKLDARTRTPQALAEMLEQMD